MLPSQLDNRTDKNKTPRITLTKIKTMSRLSININVKGKGWQSNSSGNA
jgi:hypothetical protein